MKKKVITKCVINMATNEVVEEESYEYEGKWAQCFGGGGGGASGAVSWPSYLQNAQANFLNDTGADLITQSMAASINNAHSSNPYTGLVGTSPSGKSYDPDSQIGRIDSAMSRFESTIDDIASYSTWTNHLQAATQGYDSILYPDPMQWNVAIDAAMWIINSWNDQGTIDDFWKSLLPEAPANISGMWISPAPDAQADIFGNWVEPSPTSPSDISGEWEDPSPEAAVDIAGDWVDPSPDAVTNIGASWVSPAPDAESDIKTNLANDAEIAADVAAFGTVMDDRFTTEIQPRFEAGMRDINAVMSSAFAIGRAIIEGMNNRDVAQFQGELRYKAFLQRDNLLGQAYMQDDKILAMDVMEKDKALTEAYIRNDRLLAESNLEENRSVAQAYLQKDKLLASNTDGKNKSIAQAYIDKDRIVSADVGDKNKTLSQAFLQDDKLLAGDTEGKNRALTQAYLDVDKINAEDANTKNKAKAAELELWHKIASETSNHAEDVLAEDVKTKRLVAIEQVRDRSDKILRGIDQILQMISFELDYDRVLTHFTAETERIKYVMKKEEYDKGVEYEVADEMWDINVFQPGANMLAAISGGTGYQPPITPGQTAIGGAFTGAAIGARVSGGQPWGAAAGAIIGGIGSYLLSSS